MNKIKRIFFITFPGASLLDFIGPSSVFAAVNEFESPHQMYDIQCLSTSGGLIEHHNGIQLLTKPLTTVRFNATDTVLVTGAPKVPLANARCDQVLKDAVLSARERCCRFGSICTGALILADSGVLDDAQSCTHWASQGELQKTAPRSNINLDALFTVDGNLWMSAGVTTGIDMALAMVEQDMGKVMKSKVARHLLVYAQRSGHQTQFSDVLLTQTQRDTRYSNLIEWLRENLHSSIKVEDMANFMSMSPRSFHRHFVKEFTQSPSSFLRTLRLDKAQLLLESGKPVELVAGEVGFASVSAFRSAFKDYVGISPRQYAGMAN